MCQIEKLLRMKCGTYFKNDPSNEGSSPAIRNSNVYPKWSKRILCWWLQKIKPRMSTRVFYSMTISKKQTPHKNPQIKTLIGHTGEHNFGCAAGREDGEKAHLNLLAFRRTMHRMPTRRGSSPAAHWSTHQQKKSTKPKSISKYNGGRLRLGRRGSIVKRGRGG